MYVIFETNYRYSWATEYTVLVVVIKQNGWAYVPKLRDSLLGIPFLPLDMIYISYP